MSRILTQLEAADRIDYLHGGKLTLVSQYRGQHLRVSVMCSVCGQTTSPRCNDLFQGHGCRPCRDADTARRFAKAKEHFEALIHTVSEGRVRVVGDITGSKGKVRVACTKCAFEWEAKPNNLICNQSGCPKCVESKGERRIADILDRLRIIYVREWRHKTCRLHKRATLEFDFYLPDYKSVIEFDGRQHTRAVRAWGGEAYLERLKKRDAFKDTWAANNGVRMVRINYTEDIEFKLHAALGHNQ